MRDSEDGELAIIEATPGARSVSVRMLTTDAVLMVPDRIDQFRDFLGLAAGLARESSS